MLCYSQIVNVPIPLPKNLIMTDTEHQGIMAMVKIDGNKVKRLREQKGLTQLYVATAVQVTTDTISRWENKRYPKIKKENGIKLAEALEVELSDILDNEIVVENDTTETVKTDSSSENHMSNVPKRRISIVVSLIAFLALSLFFSITFFYSGTPVHISAQRILPSTCTISQPFPVTIEVQTTSTEPLTIIVKEQFPSGASIIASTPSLPAGTHKNNTLKWLDKVSNKTLFTYIAAIQEDESKDHNFTGTIAANSSEDSSIPITGNGTIQTSTFHWVDRDRDNVISDSEILAVYDQHGDLEKLGINVDLIEEIWLGSGYIWSQEKQKYEILP